MFRDLGIMVIYFQGSGNKGHLFEGIIDEWSFILWDLGIRVIYVQGSRNNGHLFSRIWE